MNGFASAPALLLTGIDFLLWAPLGATTSTGATGAMFVTPGCAAAVGALTWVPQGRRLSVRRRLPYVGRQPVLEYQQSGYGNIFHRPPSSPQQRSSCRGPVVRPDQAWPSTLLSSPSTLPLPSTIPACLYGGQLGQALPEIAAATSRLFLRRAPSSGGPLFQIGSKILCTLDRGLNARRHYVRFRRCSLFHH